jgi:hypothetical protein
MRKTENYKIYFAAYIGPFLPPKKGKFKQREAMGDNHPSAPFPK